MIVDGWELIPYISWMTTDGRVSISRDARSRWSVAFRDQQDRALFYQAFSGRFFNGSLPSVVNVLHQVIGCEQTVTSGGNTSYIIPQARIVVSRSRRGPFSNRCSWRLHEPSWNMLTNVGLERRELSLRTALMHKRAFDNLYGAVCSQQHQTRRQALRALTIAYGEYGIDTLPAH